MSAIPKDNRLGSGQTAAVAAVVVLIVIVLGAGLLGFALLYKSSGDLQGAVDAGNIHVAKLALVQPAVELTREEEILQFSGIAQQQVEESAGTRGGGSTANAGSKTPATHRAGGGLNPPRARKRGHTPGTNRYFINLANINRLWGQTMFVLQNVREMLIDGQAASQAETNGHAMFKLASDIEKRLCDRLEQKDTKLEEAFLSIAARNPIGGNTGSLRVGDWSTSYADEGREANVYVHPSCKREAQNPDDLPVSTVLGYKNYRITYGGTQCLLQFVPLGEKEKPHLIALPSRKPSAAQWPSKVPPNAFGFSAEIKTGAGQKLKASSLAVVKDVDSALPISIPHGFILIKNMSELLWSHRKQDNRGQYVNWSFEGDVLDKTIFICRNEKPDWDQINSAADIKRYFPHIDSNPQTFSGIARIIRREGWDGYFLDQYRQPPRGPGYPDPEEAADRYGFPFSCKWRPATLAELVSDFSEEMRAALVQRIYQIKPDASEKEIDDLLKSPKEMDLGEKYAICMDDSKKLRLVWVGGTDNPSWLWKAVRRTQDRADETQEIDFANVVKAGQGTSTKFVKTIRQHFGLTKSKPQLIVQKVDCYVFRPGSGYDGLLGRLAFRSYMIPNL